MTFMTNWNRIGRMRTMTALAASLATALLFIAGCGRASSVAKQPVLPGCRVADPSLTALAAALRRHGSLPADHRLVKAPPSPRGLIPIGLQARLRSRGSQLGDVLARMSAAGLRYSREDFQWAAIEPRPGQYCWSKTDYWMFGAARARVHIIAVVDAPPSWAERSVVSPPVDPAGLRNYSAFARQVLGRYGAYGSFWSQHPYLTPDPITLVDVWNEPWVHYFWHDDFPDPTSYARMFERVVHVARSVDPGAHFMLEADTTSLTGGAHQRPFLAAELEAQPAIARDAYAISVHPYASNGWGPGVCSRGPKMSARRYQLCRIVDMRKILDQHGAGRVKIFITELGWGAYTTHTGGVSLPTVARYVHQTFHLLRTRWKGLASGVIWYQYQSSPGTIGHRGDFGLIQPTGIATPGWDALAAEARQGVKN